MAICIKCGGWRSGRSKKTGMCRSCSCKTIASKRKKKEKEVVKDG